MTPSRQLSARHLELVRTPVAEEGEGWVDWPRYLEYLQQAGYDGYFAIKREVGDDPVGDVRQAVEFLRGL